MSKKETVFSWSRLNSFAMAESGDGCYWGFNLQYNVGDRGEGNYFTEYGLLVHETIEKLHNNELLAWDIDDELKRGLDNFTFKVPFAKMRNSYETSLFGFFNDFDETFAKYKILEAEEEKSFEVEGVKLRGFPDLVAEHEEHGLIIGDYKTSKVYTGDKLHHNIMQLYLYSIPIYEQYGRYPDNLIYIFPREKAERERVYKFNLDDLERTKQWVKATAAKIAIHDEWKARCKDVDGSKDFYACNLCNNRRSCEFRWVNADNQSA